MRKSWKSLLVLPALAVMVAFAAFAPVGNARTAVAAEPTEGIVDILVANPGFSTLVAAAQAADLVDVLAGPGPFTLFAPTNEAFARLLSELGVTADELFANKPLLTSVLLYHVAAGRLYAADVLAAESLTMVDGNPAAVTVSGGKAFIAGAEIDRVDIEASNGVIHVIHDVMLPPMPAAAPVVPTDSIVDILLVNPGFATLVAAAQAADLVDVLAGPGPYTLFAPTNEAFARLLAKLGVSAQELFANEALLTDVLLYHVAPGRLYAADVLAAGTLTMANGSPAAVTVSNGKAYIAGAEIDRVDINATNGVIHVIHDVMLPPAN
jgi:transforming growth factor-beta-induced protein